MGNCSSCLGTRRRSTTGYDDDEESRLFDDVEGGTFGTFEPIMNDQDGAQESQREFEALQNVVARTSDNMVDVFEIVPQRPNPFGHPSQYTMGIPDNRYAQYQNLLSKLSVTDDDDPDAQIEEYTISDATAPTYHDDLSAKADLDGPFVGNFVDAAKSQT